MSDLSTKKCLPCEIGTPPMSPKQASDMLKQVPSWFIIGNEQSSSLNKITKDFKFPNFKEALKFVNKVSDIAEEEGHHPDICFTWGKVNISLMTHNANGLTENDFILASKIDKIKT